MGAVRVAVGVCARGAEEGDVDVNLAGFNGTRAPAVRTDDDRLFHQAVGDCGADLVAQAAAGDLGDHAVFDVLNERLVHIGDRAGGELQVFNAHFGNLVQHHVQNIVALTKVVVE